MKKTFTFEELKTAYQKGFRNGGRAGVRVARGGELRVITFLSWYRKKCKNDRLEK